MVLKCVSLLILSISSITHASIRLKVDGSKLIDPSNNEKILLHGFNWYLPYVSDGDLDQMKSLLPATNAVRIVGVFWDNWVSGNALQKDCRTNNAAHGYIKQSCIENMHNAVKEATKDNSTWAFITGRAEYAAGQGYPTYPDVFHNDTLKQQYYVMWEYVANYFKDVDYIAAYEIMSEPRTKIVEQSVVRDFYAGACKLIHNVDPDTPCMIGPAPYYKPWMLNDTLLLNDTNTIYTVDFFIPNEYITDENASLIYPGNEQCNQVYPGWTCAGRNNVQPCFCPGNPHENVYVNETWFETILLDYPLALRENATVPIMVNQWGIERTVPTTRGYLKYGTDVCSVFNKLNVHSTYWIWKWKGVDWTDYSMIFDFDNGTQAINYPFIDVLNNSWDKIS